MVLFPSQDYREDGFIGSKMTICDDFYVGSGVTCVITNVDVFSPHFLIFSHVYKTYIMQRYNKWHILGVWA